MRHHSKKDVALKYQKEMPDSDLLQKVQLVFMGIRFYIFMKHASFSDCKNVCKRVEHLITRAAYYRSRYSFIYLRAKKSKGTLHE